MSLLSYSRTKDGKLQKLPSLFNATPLFTIDMPDGEKAPVYDFKNFPFEIFKTAPTCSKRGKTIDKVSYYDLAVSFDIETTTIEDAEKPFAFMYQWQYCIEDYVFMGKTWEEFMQLNDKLTDVLNLHIENSDGRLYGRSIVCYVHNLSFEFTFAYAFMGEMINPLFTDVYAPLVVPTAGGITYKCAYRLTNKSLDAFTKDVPHHKLKGDLDYTKTRTPVFDDVKNGLTDLELAYCYNDVKGLSEALRKRFDSDDKYNIATIPLTSTGYVRKDCRNSMRKNPKCKANFQSTRLTPHLYELCRLGFRGGNTHSNAKYTGVTVGVNNVGIIHHVDLTSSYPYQIMCKGFPITAFQKYDPQPDFLNRLKVLSERWCFLIKFKIFDFEYCGNYGVPYIAKAKTFTRIEDGDNGKIREDNGRIYSAPVGMLVMTEIDMLILLRNYRYSKIEIMEVYRSRKGLLPYELRRVCQQYYKKKCELSGSKDPAILYERARSKELLNACYGLMCMRIDRIEYKFNNGEYIPTKRPLEDMLKEFYDADSSFLPYQWALWVTAHARADLDRGCEIVGKNLLYIDTDSIFYFGDFEKEFDELNREIRAKALKYGAVGYNSNGDEFPCGIWSKEDDIKLFRTLGAKKYLLSVDGEHIESTISGVNKQIGAEYFTEHGFEAFTNETVIPVSGKVSAHYNKEEPHYINVNGVKILTASNIALISASYTINIKKDYKDFIEYIRKSLNFYYKGVK